MQNIFKRSLYSIVVFLVLIQSAFALNTVKLNPEYYPNPTIGRPLSNANIYVGIVDLDPETPANQKQISVLQENGTTVEVTQPIVTGGGGVPLYNGSPVTILVDGPYSLKVTSRTDEQVYYVPSDSAVDSNDGYDSIASLRATTYTPGDGEIINLLGYYDKSENRDWRYQWDESNTETDNGGTIIKVTSIATGRWVSLDRFYITAAQFGSATTGDNTATLQAASDSLTGGGTLVLENFAYTIDSTWTISGDNIDVIVETGATITHTVEGNSNIALGPLVDAKAVVIAGDSCSFTGGEIISPEHWDGLNIIPTFGVVWITGQACNIKNVILTNVQKTGIAFSDSDGGSIKDCIITGNYPTAEFTGAETAHFGILYDPGTNASLLVNNNRIFSCVTGMFDGNYGLGSSKRVIVTENIFTTCLDHGIYVNVDLGIVITDNTFFRCRIPIVYHGQYGIVSDNILYTNVSGSGTDEVGISMRDPSFCVVTGNVIKGDAPTAAIVINLTNLDDTTTFSVDNNIVANNTIELTGGTSAAINLGSNTYTEQIFNNKVHHNIIKGDGTTTAGLITIFPNIGEVGYDNEITYNNITITGKSDGIFAARQERLKLIGNTFRLSYNATVPSTIKLVNFALDVNNSEIEENYFICDSLYGLDVSLIAIDIVASCNYNSINTNKFFIDETQTTSYVPLNIGSTTTSYFRNRLDNTVEMSGTATMLSGTASITVTNGNAINKNGGNVIITPTTSYGASVMHTWGYYITYVNEVSFTVTAGSVIGADFPFTYHIQ